MPMHRLVERQIRQARDGNGNLDIEKLKDLVSAAYSDGDRALRRTDRSISLMVEENDQLSSNMRDYVDALQLQNDRFEMAIENMPHGMAMYHADGGLVICNELYLKLYGLPKSHAVPGASFWDMIDHCSETGMVSISDWTSRNRSLQDVVDDAKHVEGPVPMLNGRTMFIRHHPLPGGGWLSTHEDITEQYKSEALIRHLARHDGLTGLANRTTFLEAMANGEERIRAGETMAVLCIDLDKFKPINDSLGHAVGDAVLRVAAERIAAEVGRMGIAARLGGDEFSALIGPLSGRDEAEKFAKKIISSITEPIICDGLEVNIGVSVGVAMAPSDGTETDVLMRNSDLALYSAKSDAQCRYYFFERSMDEKRRRRRKIENGLKCAIKDGSLQLHYQPLLGLDDNKISCCEALMRWTCPDTGIIGPDEFIPIAEETGLIRELGRWALEQACTQATNWPEHVRVAVNVSAVQFVNNDLLQQVIDVLKKTGLAAKRLELEITESLYLADDTQNLRILHALRDMGVRIALDDFGTGYSSLSYFRSFPFDKIKIDRSFIANLEMTSDAVAIVKAIVQLGRSLGMSTTAEGIETEGQLETVRMHGCTEVQGYLFSPPLPQKAISELLMRPVLDADLRQVS